jgi:dephospho-CoA kinase
MEIFYRMDTLSEKTLKIAVTGGAASGKSTVCRCLREKGLTVISLDDVSRELMKPGMPVFQSIVHRFGKGVVLSDGTLDRQVLREMITRDPGAKKDLESMVQPEILSTMVRWMAECEERKEPFVVVEVPLLFECNLESMFDVSILVTVDRDVQIRRLMARDGVSEDDAGRLLNIQMDQAEKMKRADIVIPNNHTSKDLCRNIERLREKRFQK